MKRWLCALPVFLLCLSVHGALCETYTYGGSARDWMNGVVVAADGRIAVTGYTLSSDGTLSDRTRTWRAGWVMMLSDDMQVLWNYCSRSGDFDHMHCPVFHEDGTLSVVHETEGRQMKIVRLGTNGKEHSSQTVLSQPDKSTVFGVEGATRWGYLLSKISGYGQQRSYRLYNWDGGVLAAYTDWDGLHAVGGTHILCSRDKRLSLYAVDGSGGLKKLSDVCAASADGTYSRSYSGLISLPDGGAAACGAVWEGWNQGPVNRKGLISRWDAQGNLLFEMIIELGPLAQLVRTQEGFAATAYAQTEVGGDAQWKLLRFDEAGILTGMEALDAPDSASDAGPLALRGDGSVIALMHSGSEGSEDVQAMILP